MMARYFMAAILVVGLVACASDDAEVAAIDASILMSTPEALAGQERAEIEQVPLEMSVAEDTSTSAADHSLEARIFRLPEEPAKDDYSSRVWTIFDVIPDARTNATVAERPLSSPADAVAPRQSSVATTVVAPPEPQESGAVAEISYQIQLGALPSKASAEREWMRIELHHPDLVRNHIPSIVAIEPNPEIGKVFRLRTGPVGKLEAARSLCREFRSRGQDCFVVRYGKSG